MTIRSRNVYYFSGYDPRGARYYQRLFKAESLQAGYHCQSIKTSPTRVDGKPPHLQQWAAECSVSQDANTDAPDTVIQVRHFFMKWEDIIRAHWKQPLWSFLPLCIQIYAQGLRQIPLSMVWKVNNGAIWTALLPGAFFLISLSTATLTYLEIHSAISTLAIVHSGWSAVLQSMIAATAAALILHGALRIAEHTGLLWLIRIFRFNLSIGSQKIQALEKRQHEWAEQIIRQQQADPADEVLLIGHSVGTIVMMDVVRRLLDDPRWQELSRAQPLKLLTLGQCIPFVSMNVGALALRETLGYLYGHKDLLWWDVTAKVDPLCFYRTHPLPQAGPNDGLKPTIHPAGDEPAIKTLRPDNPRFYSARFFRMYEPQRWRRLKRNKLKIHFLYLKYPDKNQGFNLYKIMHGKETFESHMQGAAHAQP
jgi:pimeloyl-ACP methyl ester carboxylesterase